MTEYLLSIDPGVSTGIALLSFEEDSPAELVQGWQFTGGVVGLTSWIKGNWGEEEYDFELGEQYGAGLWISGNGRKLHVEEMTVDIYYPDRDEVEKVVAERKELTVIAEKFTARNTQGFSYKTSSLEPLRGEGALIAMGLMPDYAVAEKRWRDPGLQYFAGGTGKAERKKRQHAFLKANGFYRTGKDFGTADADDFRSAAAHGINYIARELKHKPTFDMISEWTEKN